MAIERAVSSTISPCYNLLHVHIELKLRRRVVTGNLKEKKLANSKPATSPKCADEPLGAIVMKVDLLA
jgi:hypothetical protein